MLNYSIEEELRNTWKHIKGAELSAFPLKKVTALSNYRTPLLYKVTFLSWQGIHKHFMPYIRTLHTNANKYVKCVTKVMTSFPSIDVVFI